MKYTTQQEWLLVDGNIATVGLSAQAKQHLGDIVFIQLPEVGQVLQAGEEVVVVESTKSAIEIYTPLSGKIVDINKDVQKAPETIQGAEQWLYKIELSDSSQLQHIERCKD